MICNNYIRTLFDDVANPDAPRDRRMKILKDVDVFGYGNENTYYLLNEMVRKYAQCGTYLEIGTCQGASLIAAAHGNRSTRCIGVDNFHELGGYKNKPLLMANLGKFNFGNVEFLEGDYRKIDYAWPALDVCYYDGQHEEENEREGLAWCLQWLKPRCVLIVDDIAWEHVNRVVEEFATEHAFSYMFKTNDIGDEYVQRWHNGFCVLSRGYEDAIFRPLDRSADVLSTTTKAGLPA